MNRREMFLGSLVLAITAGMRKFYPSQDDTYTPKDGSWQGVAYAIATFNVDGGTWCIEPLELDYRQRTNFKQGTIDLRYV